MLRKHVDDWDIAGFMKYVDQLVAHVEQAFGKMKGDYESFANYGDRQTRSADCSATMGQDDYITALIPVKRVDLVKSKADQPAEGPLPDSFVGVLGVAACALLARRRVDACIKLLIMHATQLNSVITAMRNVKACVTLPAIVRAGRLVAHIDGSFKRDEDGPIPRHRRG